MVGLFERRFGVERLRDVKRIVYAPGFGAAGFAELASVVSRAAHDGDALAQAIVARAGASLAHGVAVLARRLPFTIAPIPVAPMGGAFEHVHGLREQFAAKLREEASNTIVVEPKMPPVMGAVSMAIARCAHA
jgi:N-acetylglucosamine kinase